MRLLACGNLLGTHALLNVVEGATQRMPVLIDLTVLYRQKTLGVLGGHAEQGGHEHPEEGARTASHNGRCHAHYVAGANGGRECRTERAKR